MSRTGPLLGIVAMIAVVGLRSVDDLVKFIPWGKVVDQAPVVSRRPASNLDMIGKKSEELIRPPVVDEIGDQTRTLAKAYLDQVDTVGDWFETVDNPTLVSLFPTDDVQYHRVYGRRPSITAERKLRTFREAITAEDSAIRGNVVDREQLAHAIEEHDGNPVIVLAHSKSNGRDIVFPNGSVTDVKILHSACIQLKRRCLVLTCHGDDFEITTKISANDALGIWRAVKTRAMSSGDVSVADLVEEAVKVGGRRRTRRRIVISWAAMEISGRLYVADKEYRDTASERDPSGSGVAVGGGTGADRHAVRPLQ